MKTDGLFTLKKVNIPFDKYGEPITFSLTGDWHHGTAGHAKDHFIEYLRRSKEKKSYMIGLGDYLDLMSSSERRFYNNSEFHETTETTLDELVENKVDELANLVNKYMKGRVIGLIGGNHYFKTSAGITSDQMLCQKLGCMYLGVNCMLKMVFNYGKSKYSNQFVFCLHHGRPGKTPGSSINKLKEMANSFDADAIVQGHNHDRQVDYINRLGISSQDKLIDRKILLARTGSFLRSYMDGKSSYAVDASYSPGDIGGIYVDITPMRKDYSSNGVRSEERWLNVEATI